MHSIWQQFLLKSQQNCSSIMDLAEMNSRMAVPLCNMGIIRATGENVQKFLQGQLSNDVTRLQDGQAQLNCYCNHKGRIIGILWLVRTGKEYLLVAEKSTLPLLQSELNKFAAFSKIAIAVEDSYAIIGLINQNPETPMLSGDDVLSICIPGTPLRQIDLIPYGNLKPVLAHCTIAPLDLWVYYNIINGVPSITNESQEEFTPHQLNLVTLGAVNFKKGCYRGQEIVARMQYLGHLKQALFKVELSGTAILPGTSLLDPQGQTLGQMVNVFPVESGKSIALAVLNKALVTDIMPLKQGQTLKIL